MRVGFIGLGKLGLVCAEAMGKHYPVIGFDIFDRDSDIINHIGN